MELARPLNSSPTSPLSNSTKAASKTVLLGDRERNLQRRFLLFASLFMLIIFGAAVIVLLSAAQRANEVEVRAGLRTINSILKDHIDELRGEALESAFWDDMHEQVISGFDPAWVDNNIGQFLHKATDLSLTLVMDKQNTPLVYVEEGISKPPGPLQNMTPMFEASLQALRQGPLDPPEVSAGLLLLSDDIHVVSLAPVSPERPAPGFARQDRAIFMLGRALTPDRLAKIADDFGLTGLAFSSTEPATPALQQFDMSGEPIGWITWTPRTPGRTWLGVILPGLAVAFLAVMILGTMLTRLWQSALMRMRVQEHSLMIAVEEAINASRAKTVFLASMSHELRTPLNAVIGFSNILKTEMFGPVGSPKYLEYVKDINATSNHLLRLIDSILDWAKLEAEPPALGEEACVVTDLFADAITLSDAKTAGVAVASSVTPNELAVKGDRTKLVQIITNLLTNAIKASETDQPIHLSAHHDGNWIHIEVRDKGPGISEDVMQRLFQPFQRSTDPYRRDASGAGLGLVISMRLAELHQGHIHLKNATKGGTVASLILPAERVIHS